MVDDFPLPPTLAETCRERPEWMAWLERVPATVRQLQSRWSLTVGAPFQTGMCAWVAPAVLPDGALAKGFPFQFEDAPMQLTRAAPAIGQDTAQVLQDVGGFTPNEITALQRDGVIECAEA